MLFGTCKIPTREAPCPVLGTSALAQATHTKKLDLEVKRTQASDNTADIKRNTAELVAEPQPKQTWSSSARHKDSAAILDCVFVPDCTGSYRFRPPDYPPNCWRLFVCHARSVLSFFLRSFPCWQWYVCLLTLVATYEYFMLTRRCIARWQSRSVRKHALDHLDKFGSEISIPSLRFTNLFMLRQSLPFIVFWHRS